MTRHQERRHRYYQSRRRRLKVDLVEKIICESYWTPVSRSNTSFH